MLDGFGGARYVSNDDITEGNPYDIAGFSTLRGRIDSVRGCFLSDRSPFSFRTRVDPFQIVISSFISRTARSNPTRTARETML